MQKLNSILLIFIIGFMFKINNDYQKYINLETEFTMIDGQMFEIVTNSKYADQ